MSGGIPFRSRHGLHWQIVLVDPVLLHLAQRRLRANGPSHAIEEALRMALRVKRPDSTLPRLPGRAP